MFYIMLFCLNKKVIFRVVLVIKEVLLEVISSRLWVGGGEEVDGIVYFFGVS